MSMIEIHTEALEISNAAYHEFLLRYRSKEHIVYGFVEGKDDPIFYRGLIERGLPAGWDVELIRSGSKDKVLKVLEDFDWSRFPPKRVCFFVDRDLSEFFEGIGNPADNLYVTNSYSIENEVAAFGTLKRVLEEVLNITELSPSESDRLTELFESNSSRFREAMAPLMAQIILWRRNGVRPCLNDIRPRDFFRFADGKIALKAEFSTISSRLRHAATAVGSFASSEEDLAKAEAEFRGRQGVEKFVRGKYILWFFVECALEVHRSIPKFCIKHPSPPKVRLPLGPGNAMVVIGPRLRCPDSLQKFIDRNYTKYIKDTFGDLSRLA